MSASILRDKRVLITQADEFMGPMLCEVFAGHGASVIATTESLVDPGAPAAIVTAAGRIDALVANLALPAPSTAATEVSEAEWRETFAAGVDPLPRLFRAALPAMIQRRAGKILGMGRDAASRFVGQVFAVCGGWVTR